MTNPLAQPYPGPEQQKFQPPYQPPKKEGKRFGIGTLVGTGIGGFFAGAVSMVVFALMIDSSSTSSVSASPEPAYEATENRSDEGISSQSPTKASGPSFATVGQETENGGVTLTVNQVEELPTITLDEKGRKKGYGALEETPPSRDGAKFIRVNTTVFNSGSHTWDLTCGYAIGTALMDPDGNEYDPVDSLYRIPENPGCNDSLGHGFSDEMTWVYEVPESYELGYFAFFEPALYGGSGDPTVVDIRP